MQIVRINLLKTYSMKKPKFLMLFLLFGKKSKFFYVYFQERVRLGYISDQLCKFEVLGKVNFLEVFHFLLKVLVPISREGFLNTVINR